MCTTPLDKMAAFAAAATGQAQALSTVLALVRGKRHLADQPECSAGDMLEGSALVP